MDPIVAGAVSWLLQQGGGVLFVIAQQYLLQSFGLNASSSSPSDVQPSLEDYLEHLRRELTVRQDEDRIAKLHGAFSKLKDAPKSVAKKDMLVNALGHFHEVAQIPSQGTTKGQANAELRCMAYLGMAVAHELLQDSPTLVAEKLVQAVQTDANTAQQWLGADVVQQIMAHLPSSHLLLTCPRCGFHNPLGSKFCNRDGIPLITTTTQQIAQAVLSDVNPYAPWGTLTVNGNARNVFDEKGRSAAVGNSATIQSKRGIQTVWATKDPTDVWSTFFGPWKTFIGDFAFHVEMKWLNSAPYPPKLSGGIFFRHDQGFYYFSVNSQNEYSLDFIDGKNHLNLASGPILVDVSTPILIGVVVQGIDIDLYVNLEHLTQVKDGNSGSGKLGIAVGNLSFDEKRPIQARFRHCMVWTKETVDDLAELK